MGRVDYPRALEWQRRLVAARQRGEIPDQLLLLEHPHVITLGRNGQLKNLLASDEILGRAGIAFYPTDRGGDVTYHGPGQLVGYPIVDLREWKRDVGAYVRAIEQTIMDTLADFGIAAGRIPDVFHLPPRRRPASGQSVSGARPARCPFGRATRERQPRGL